MVVTAVLIGLAYGLLHYYSWGVVGINKGFATPTVPVLCSLLFGVFAGILFYLLFL